MIVKAMRRSDLNWSEVTPEAVYLSRRGFLAGAALGAGMLLPGAAVLAAQLDASRKSSFSTDEPITPVESATSYNNFYEFGTDKSDPSRYASSLIVKPWKVRLEGLVDRPGDYDLDDLVTRTDLEERIYRLRCVEAWSMVIPWIGVPLSTVLNKAGPRPSAKYVAFRTLLAPDQMPGQKTQVLDWPYREGLRLDEAMHPLTILATGMYGRELPNQNGAPLRLVVPWKYGFKSIKSIVSITLTDRQPATTWSAMAPREYGFFANVDPTVDHPRWSQAKERRIGEWLRRPTLPFNGYAEQVASLYAGMDPKTLY